jgi:hypothetical protein
MHIITTLDSKECKKFCKEEGCTNGPCEEPCQAFEDMFDYEGI